MGRTARIGGVLALSAGLLAGCTSSEDPPAQPQTTPAEVVTDQQPDEPDLSPGQDESPDPVPGQDGAATAMSTASDELDGHAFALDRSDDSGEELWEVSVAVGDEEIDVHVSLDGNAIVDEERAEPLDDDDRRRLAEVSVAASEAAVAAARELGATVEEVDLDDENGTVVWEIELRTSDGASTEARVDAVTGELL